MSEVGTENWKLLLDFVADLTKNGSPSTISKIEKHQFSKEAPSKLCTFFEKMRFKRTKYQNILDVFECVSFNMEYETFMVYLNLLKCKDFVTFDKLLLDFSMVKIGSFKINLDRDFSSKES